MKPLIAPLLLLLGTLIGCDAEDAWAEIPYRHSR